MGQREFQQGAVVECVPQRSLQALEFVHGASC
jgi:hypothetical protein